jgi:hypothetical protein
MKENYVIYDNYYREKWVPGRLKGGLLISITYSDGMG